MSSNNFHRTLLQENTQRMGGMVSAIRFLRRSTLSEVLVRAFPEHSEWSKNS